MALLPLMKLRGAGLHVGIVTARFNAPICEKLLAGAKKALADMGVDVNVYHSIRISNKSGNGPS